MTTPTTVTPIIELGLCFGDGSPEDFPTLGSVTLQPGDTTVLFACRS